jgi:hypothetical protein
MLETQSCWGKLVIYPYTVGHITVLQRALQMRQHIVPEPRSDVEIGDEKQDLTISFYVPSRQLD